MVIFDFREGKCLDVEARDKKKDTLIELIDALEEGDTTLMNDKILKEVMVLVRHNIFRTFLNKLPSKAAVDPDEDEPHLEEAWPHLQLIYELLLKFVMTNTVPT